MATMIGGLPLFVLAGSAAFASQDVHTLNKTAHDLIIRGRYTEAESVLEQARNSTQQTDFDKASVLSNLGTVYWNLGRLRQARHAYEESLDFWKAAGESEGRAAASTLNDLGVIYKDLNYLGKSEEMLQRAEALHLAHGEQAPLAKVWMNLAGTYQAERRWSNAEEMFRRSIALYERVPNAPKQELGNALNNLGAFLRDRGRIPESTTLIRRAVELWQGELEERHPLLALGLNNLGVSYTKAGELNKAEEILSRAVRLSAELLPEDHPSLAVYRRNYAYVLRKLGRKDEARRLEASARSIQEKYIRENLLGGTVDAHQLEN